MSSDEHNPLPERGERRRDSASGADAETTADELRRLNEALEQRSAELERREREFRTLADNVPALFSYLDADQRYRYVNRRYEKHWGQPAAEGTVARGAGLRGGTPAHRAGAVG